MARHSRPRHGDPAPVGRLAQRAGGAAICAKLAATPAHLEGLSLRPRIFVAEPFAADSIVTLHGAAARHLQVLRLQPADLVTLFNGDDGAEWPGEIVRIGRREVEVRLGAPSAVDRELACDVTIAVGVPANDRMDALVEKAGELGAAAIQPLACERSVVRLAGDRAAARRAHWQGVAAAASEQCGRARVTRVLPVTPFAAWLGSLDAASRERRIILSFAGAALDPESAFGAAMAAPGASSGALAGTAASLALPDPPVGLSSSPLALRDPPVGPTPSPLALPESIVILSGPEGGLAPAEEDAAVRAGFVRVGLGPRVLRADTAPLAVLAWLALRGAGVGKR